MTKKISPQRKKELTDWAYRVWKTHWRDLAPVSNSRALFLKYVLRDHQKLDDEMLDMIARAIVVQTALWKKEQKKGTPMIGIPCLSTWYNSERYDDVDVDADHGVEDKHVPTMKPKTCDFPGCSDEVHGPMFSRCAAHINMVPA